MPPLRAVFCGCRSFEELVSVDFLIQDGGTLLSQFFHLAYAAFLLDPKQRLQGAVDGNDGGRVKH